MEMKIGSKNRRVREIGGKIIVFGSGYQEVQEINRETPREKNRLTLRGTLIS